MTNSPVSLQLPLPRARDALLMPEHTWGRRHQIVKGKDAMGIFRSLVCLATRTVLLIAAAVRSVPGQSILWGVAAGLFTIAFVHPFVARFGGALATIVGALAAVALALTINGRPTARSVRPSIATRAAWSALLVVWTFVAEPFAELFVRAGHWFEIDVFEHSLVQHAVGFSAAIVLLGIPIGCGLRLTLCRSRLSAIWMLIGGSAGLILAAYGIAPRFGVEWTGRLAAAGTACALMLTMSVGRRNGPALNAGTRGATTTRRPVGWLDASVALVGAGVVGMIAAGLTRLIEQLFPTSEASQWTQFAGFLVGVAAAYAFIRETHPALRIRRTAQVIAVTASGCTLILLLFPVFVDRLLDATSSISHVGLLTLLRAAIAAGLLFPLGAAWAALPLLGRRNFDLADQDASPTKTGKGDQGMVPFATALVLGYALAASLIPRGLHVPMLVGGGAIFLGLLASFHLLRLWDRGFADADWLGLAVVFGFAEGTSTTNAPSQTVVNSTEVGEDSARRRWQQVQTVLAWTRPWRFAVGSLAITCALLTSSLIMQTYDPARAARLLFSTAVFMAHHAGTESRLLPFLDEARLVCSRETDGGTYTVWKYRGVQYQLRASGIPKGTFCTRPEICPLYSGEVMAAVLPLTLHESPHRVLVLGLTSGSLLGTCLEFPVTQVTCVESDAGLVRVLKEKVWHSASTDPSLDNRLQLVTADPAVAVQAKSGAFDVIVANSDQAGVTTGTAYYTREFYSGVARQLTDDGIFAQRFQQIDFGPWPLCSLLATWNSVFPNVAAVESGAGELVLLGTRSPQGLTRPGASKRFQTPQVRRALSRLGWDWSVALNFASYDGEACAHLASQSTRINTASNGLFTYGLPQETMRWGNKSHEVVALLALEAGRIAMWPNVDGDDPELARRVADVTTQRTLMTDAPDQPWAYRKVLREDLEKHPRSAIETTLDSKMERQRHPVDQHRIDYFVALGQAIQTGRSNPDSLHRLEEFAEPYDPLVTYFLHHEIAAQYARAGSFDVPAELRHRLYTIYYSDPRDRSIRDVVDSLALLAKSASALEPSERWDHMNALMEMLKARWSNRGLMKPQSPQVVLNDLDRTINTVETSFAAMGGLCAEVGVPPSDWIARRNLLERSLVDPLRSYRSELIPYFFKQSRQTAETEKPQSSPARQSAN